MRRSRSRLLKGLPAALAVAACVAVMVAEDACILAEPSGELPRIPESRPTIVHPSLVPSESAVLTQWPSVFLVPVELSDPTVSFNYVSFIDYNPLTGDGQVAPQTQSIPDPNSGRVRTVDVVIPVPLDPTVCHRIEIIVALRFKADTDPKNAHTPDEPGGDVATWFYNPNGDLGGCPSLDAGIEASTEVDASEGGVQ
jgi:hypothetical protein